MPNANDPKNGAESESDRLLLDHEYDGIRELDFPLPRWWLMIFYATIVFGVGYAGYYMAGPGPGQLEELSSAMKEIEAKKAAVQANDSRAGRPDDWTAAPERLAAGKLVYVGKCVPCHGQSGEGAIGPNLTDDYWIHGDGSPQSIAKVVREGVLEKGMPAWNEMLSADELRDVVLYAASLRGSRPANAKAPQGELRATAAGGSSAP